MLGNSNPVLVLVQSNKHKSLSNLCKTSLMNLMNMLSVYSLQLLPLALEQRVNV